MLPYEPMSSVASMRKLRAEGSGWGSSGTARTDGHRDGVVGFGWVGGRGGI